MYERNREFGQILAFASAPVEGSLQGRNFLGKSRYAVHVWRAIGETRESRDPYVFTIQNWRQSKNRTTLV